MNYSKTQMKNITIHPDSFPADNRGSGNNHEFPAADQQAAQFPASDQHTAQVPAANQHTEQLFTADLAVSISAKYAGKTQQDKALIRKENRNNQSKERKEVIRQKETAKKQQNRNNQSEERKKEIREKDAAKKQQRRKKMPPDKKMTSNEKHAVQESERWNNLPLDQKLTLNEARKQRRNDLPLDQKLTSNEARKQRRNNLPLDQKLTSNKTHAAQESIRRKNRTLEESLAYKESRVRFVKQGNLILDQPDDMPKDDYLNSFESNPHAAQVLRIYFACFCLMITIYLNAVPILG